MTLIKWSMHVQRTLPQIWRVSGRLKAKTFRDMTPALNFAQTMCNMFKNHNLVAEALSRNPEVRREIFVYCVWRGQWTTSEAERDKRALAILYIHVGVNEPSPFPLLFSSQIEYLLEWHLSNQDSNRGQQDSYNAL